MSVPHDKPTIASMTILASAAAVLLHEGLGHGVTAWLRGDEVTMLTSNHLSTIHPDRWVDAAGTLVNIAVGLASLMIMRLAAPAAQKHANTRYFFWLLAALNLLPAAGYFMLSGIFAFGDWYEVIRGLPHQALLRIAMTIAGAAAYMGVVRVIAVTIRPFAPDEKTYNTVARLPYWVSGLFSCAAGIFDPLGLKLLLLSTIPAAFGGSSGLMWGDSYMPKPTQEPPLVVQRQPAWWIAATVLGSAYIYFLGRGISFSH